MLDKLTGKAVETMVDEYSTVYGEILVGMHQELQALQAEVTGLRESKRGTPTRARLKLTDRLLSISALLVALVALAVAL